MVRRLLRASLGVPVAAILAATVFALCFSGAVAADPSPAGAPGAQAAGSDPPLSPFASVPLTTPGGTIQSTIYDGANTETSGGSLAQTFGFPPASTTTKTTVVMSDGQLPGNAFTITGSGPTFADPNAFPGSDPHPAGWSFGGLWDTRSYDVSSAILPGDTSATATASGGGDDCITWVAQVVASGAAPAFANAGYVAAGVGLRDQGSGTIGIAGIPAGAYIARAYLYWANINPSDPGGAMQINGHSVTSHLDGVDGSPCWPPTGGNNSIFAYSANVTSLVNGNGTYTLSGYPTGLTGGQDPWANVNAVPMMEGASLVVFYGQMTSTGTTFNSTEGAPFSGTVATFTEPDASAPASQYTATINWGDATTSAGTVAGPVGGPFTVNGTHTYTEEGTYPVKVTITDTVNSSNTTTANSTAHVADAALTAGALTLAGGVEGVTPGSASFKFTDANPFGTASDFTATITWGDAATSAGTVTGPTGGPFTVTGSHQYAEEGTYSVKVSVVDDGGSTTSGTGTATVADAPLAASCATPTVSTAVFAGPVATFTDANPNGTVADFTATIDWGDATTSPGVVTGPVGGPFTVSGAHTYATLGSHTITVSIVDDGGSTATAGGCTVLTYTPVPFVIGNGNSANGTAVTFWGSQWWKLNTLSAGAAPASFKGYALKPATPSCGTDWTTGPGNSPPPPAGPLPAFMGVIVTSSTSQSGSEISGNTVHMVVVQTNAGYSNDPGHPGTGTVIAQIC
ncbi:MAG TPA: PKD domain-containing protein [Gaiellaceae bacterium]